MFPGLELNRVDPDSLSRIAAMLYMGSYKGCVRDLPGRGSPPPYSAKIGVSESP